ncbi:sulfate reduction electron transfer complex DsrMKJOP subunit DsrJ [Desulforhopalus vacuolatus]|uniref:sulfate reduction electron transfer complex DsrMKJOP subunit DsrJ n=1 Tax=Desulforhopalus vacuolatus TaxID=40414 RepID=UPI001965C0A8|nr:sulfate reduction electron transfer complex DsrMKJOP subunit DsrJ [Desulforhopalus vacuolatus]MBM9519936.1 sulfate reduction electron transfer complex DsrMKJOP subunit DsrJ [Desulforhopalus vacuolatus]
MYNKGLIVPGLIITVLLVTFPFWFDVFSSAESTDPTVELPPGGEQNCIYPADEMRAEHMVILNEWRDDVLRNGNRGTVTVDGKVYGKGLQLACMKCHTNKEEFCDRCHTYASVVPYCWDCHLTPTQQKAGLKEAN